ncbi:MAG: hypothetical protein ACTTH5_04800 [Wolinella sp.]
MQANELKRVLRNALNRTLTKISKEQKRQIIARTHIKPKYLKRRLKRVGASADDLRIQIFSNKTAITPHMLEQSARPKGNDYGEPKGRKVYVRGVRKNGSTTQGNTGGFIARLKPQAGKRRAFYYLQKLANLDDEALKATSKLLIQAQEIFAQELER